MLLHGGLLGGLDWKLPQWQPLLEPPAFDAQLVSIPATVVAPRQPISPASNPSTSYHPAQQGVASPPPQPLDNLDTSVSAPDVVVAEPSVDVAAVDAVTRVEEAPVTPLPAGPALNPLPHRLDLRFEVQYGPASGEQTLLWVDEGDGRYTVTSVAAATGLAGLLYRGRFVQTSRGLITSRGLQPEEFWDQRGNKRSSARFNAAKGLLTLSPEKGEPRHIDYQGDVQDAVSLFFQLVLTAPPSEQRLTYRVFNGKKLRDYTYEVRGEATLETVLGALRTLHLVRIADGDGRFEAWLAIDRHYLPVRVLRSDEKGNEMELRIQSITP